MPLPSIQQQAHRPNTSIINKARFVCVKGWACWCKKLILQSKKTACYNNEIKEYNINKDEKIDLECKCENSFSCSIKKGEESNVKRKVILPETINAPIEKGQIVGNVVYYLGDTPIGKNNIISDREIKNMVEPKKNFFYSIMNFFRKCLGGK